MPDEVNKAMVNKEVSMPHILSLRGVVLVVEDRLTEVYLRELFSDIVASFVVAGGCLAVKGLVNYLRCHDNSATQRVFGVVDCDFSKSNYLQWEGATKGAVDVFRLVRTETENYLLCGKAMNKAAIRLAAPKPFEADRIEEMIRREAAEQKFWMACRRVVSSLHERLCNEFPRHPGRSQITSIDSAVAYIWNEPWIQSIKARATEAIDEVGLEKEITSAADDYERSLRDGTWVESCSGKEVYNAICQEMFQDVAHKRDDFAKAIAEVQRNDSLIPDDLVKLHDILHSVYDNLQKGT